MIKIRI